MIFGRKRKYQTSPRRHRRSRLLAAMFLAAVLLVTTASHSGWLDYQALQGDGDLPTVYVGSQLSPSDFPSYEGSPYVSVNGNQPRFTPGDFSAGVFEYYSEQDPLGRCHYAYANIGEELMPTQERTGIGMIKPSGWQTVKYDFIDGRYLYNRCHLIAYQLAGENANEQNLITGTRYLNIQGMLPFENQVAAFIRETGYHVLYRVTPLYEGKNLLASGVLMEAESVEDQGKGIRFYVYCYNVQPGVEIDYSTGKSWEAL